MNRHFVITTCGTSGDIFPFLEIGKYLLKNNYKVSFITNPSFENVIRDHSLRFVPFGTSEENLAALNDPAIWHPRKGFNALWVKTIQPNMHCVRSFIQSLRPDEEAVILSHPALMALANLARADRKNLKIILFYLYPTIIRTYFGKMALGAMTLPPKTPKFLRKLLYRVADSMFLDVATVPDLNKERMKLGMTAIEHFLPHLQSSADLYVTLFPEWYASTKPDFPKPLVSGDFVLFTSSNDMLNDELTRFLDAGDPPILFTAGTGNLHARRFFEIAVDVVKRLNTRAVFLTKFRNQLPIPLPDSVLWQEYAPFNKALPRMSTIVHHGGIGTLAEASKAGVSQLIVPSAYDQFDNALIIKDLGIGQSIPMQFLTRNNLFNKLSQIQQSRTIKEKCMSISSNFKSSLQPNQILERVLSAI